MTFAELCKRIDEISDQHGSRPGFIQALKEELANLVAVVLPTEQEKNKLAVEDKPDAVLMSSVVLNEPGNLLAHYLTFRSVPSPRETQIEIDKLVGPQYVVECFLTKYATSTALTLVNSSDNLIFESCRLLRTGDLVITDGLAIAQNVLLASPTDLSAAAISGRNTNKDR